MTKTALTLVLILAGLLVPTVRGRTAEPPRFVPVPAELVRPRDGLGNVIAKLRAGQPVKIAYLGGSITAAPGWRIQSPEWFRRHFPKAKVEAIHAAIGGTGSDLGVFRLEHDVLRNEPDLLFVEFAVNDGLTPPDQIARAMEGIVRQTWAAKPRTDICFVYTFRVGNEEQLAQGLCPTSASVMETLADHYGIPSINVALRVVELEQQQKLIFQSDSPTPQGVIRFSEDGVHPLEEGHRIYTDVIAQAVLDMEKTSEPVDHRRKLDSAMMADHWQAAKMVPITAAMMEGDWSKLDGAHPLSKQFSDRLGPLWESRAPGSRLTFRFRGSQVKLYDLMGPDGGQVIITVDGERRPKPVARFDRFCTYHRLAALPVAQGLDADQVHTVSVEVHPQEPDRRSVASRLDNPEAELASPKYQGTNLRVGQILLVGELVE